MIKDTIVELLKDAEPKACFTVGDKPWPRRMLSAMAGFVMVCAMGASPQAMAGGDHRGHTADFLAEVGVEFVELGALESRPSESKSDFMLRTARYLDSFTRATGHEACGTIASNEEGQWRVRLVTNRAQLACVLVDFDEDDKGWEPTDETIHSHPLKQYSFKTNLQDNTLTRLMGDGRVCGGRVRTDDLNFSPTDYENGPGYLVARGRLFYQSQPGERMELGKVDQKSPLEPLMIDAQGEQRAGIARAAAAVWSTEDSEGLPRTQCNPIKR